MDSNDENLVFRCHQSNPALLDSHPHQDHATGLAMQPIPTVLRLIMSLLIAIYHRTEPKEPETPPDPRPGLLSTEAAAKFLAISPESLRRLCRRKAINYLDIVPGEYRFDQADLDEYVNSRRHHRKSVFKRGK